MIGRSEDFDVVIVDDDPSVLPAFERQVKLLGFSVLSFSKPHHALPDLLAGHGKCLLLDYSMPDMNGLDLQHHLQARERPLEVVFVSGQGSIKTAMDAIKQGAFDFLEKPVELDQLRIAILGAMKRFEEKEGSRSLKKEAQLRYETLTVRQKQVLDAIAHGQSHKSIADELGITERTVKAHRSEIRSKLGITSLPDLIAFTRLVTQEISHL